MKSINFKLAPLAVALCWLPALAADPPAAGSAASSGWSGSAAGTPAPEPRIIRGTDKVLAAPVQPPAVEGAPSAFKIEDAPIADVVHVILRELLKVDYVLHPPFNGTVTLVTRGEVSADQAAFLLETALQANGLLMVRDARGTYHVGRPEALKGIVAVPRQAGDGAAAPRVRRHRRAASIHRRRGNGHDPAPHDACGGAAARGHGAQRAGPGWNPGPGRRVAGDRFHLRRGSAQGHVRGCLPAEVRHGGRGRGGVANDVRRHLQALPLRPAPARLPPPGSAPPVVPTRRPATTRFSAPSGSCRSSA